LELKQVARDPVLLVLEKFFAANRKFDLQGHKQSEHDEVVDNEKGDANFESQGAIHVAWVSLVEQANGAAKAACEVANSANNRGAERKANQSDNCDREEEETPAGGTCFVRAAGDKAPACVVAVANLVQAEGDDGGEEGENPADERHGFDEAG